MRVLLVSDSHGRNQNMEKVIRKVSPVDLLIHLGDLEGSEGYLEAIAPCPVEMVAIIPFHWRIHSPWRQTSALR